MKKLTLEIKGICMAGGDVVVNANDYSIIDLKGIAITAGNYGVKMYIKNACDIPALNCKGIAMAGGKGTVIFDFSE